MKGICFFCVAFILVFAQHAGAQKTSTGFRALSAPEKRWVIAHPFIAKKAYRCSLKARAVTDSLDKAGVLADGMGGQLDAYRHAYWMAILVQEISPRKARKLGAAHENGNYRTFKKGGMEDGAIPDSMGSVMDLANNNSGIGIGLKYREELAHVTADTSVPLPLETQVLHAVWNGELFILKKDAEGNYLDCTGNAIDLTRYAGRWNIPKCPAKSNEIIVPH